MITVDFLSLPTFTPTYHTLLSALCQHFPQCSLVVTSDVSDLSSNRLRSIQKYQTPVVGVDYVYSCLEREVLLPVDEYKLDTSSPSAVMTESTVVIFFLCFVFLFY